MTGVSEVSTSSEEHEAPSMLRSRERAGQAQTLLSKLALNEIFEMHPGSTSWLGRKLGYE